MLKNETQKITSLITLFALATSIFCLAFSPVEIDASNETVYCPLTKKLQPVHPPKRNIKKNPLNDFCASDENKFRLEQALLEARNLVSFGKISFENLAFDFFQNGKTAFKNLPNFPDFPQQNLGKKYYSLIGAGSFEKQNSLAEIKNLFFDFPQNPRPPTFQTAVKFDFQIVRDLEKISQNINPRSPPATLS